MNRRYIIVGVLVVFHVIVVTRNETFLQKRSQPSLENFAVAMSSLLRSSSDSFRVPNASNRANSNASDLRGCMSSWGIFQPNESLLTETQVIQRQSPQHDFDLDSIDDESFHGLFIDPASNFAFCAIEKNACTQWQTVLHNVMDNRTENGFQRPYFYIGKASQEKYGKEKIKQIYESPNSTVAVMVRDPLARFASAFLNKCFDLNCTNGYCFPRQPKQQGQPIAFRQAVDWVLQDKINVSTLDGHWALQSSRCGMANGGLEKYFTIVGKIGSKETLERDAACIMDQAGIGRYNIAISGENGTFWDSGGVKYKQYRQESEEDLLRKLFTPDTARQLMTKFKQDYDTFQLPEPDWIEHATGEWMDSLDHHECKNRAWR